jgi:serine/threonine-protein kinase
MQPSPTPEQLPSAGGGGPPVAGSWLSAADVADVVARLAQVNREEWTALLRADQHRRWQGGERVPAEAYVVALGRLPCAEADREEVALDLVYSEFLLCQERGEAPRMDEYLRRFPGLREGLRAQFEVDREFNGQATGQPTLEPERRKTGVGDPVSPKFDHAAEGDEGGKTLPPELVKTVDYVPGSSDPGPSLPGREADRVNVPGYQVLGVLGRGGMGVVYKAWQVALKRPVALKMILAGPQATSEELARFRTEALAVARLQHPHIVQVFELGEHEGLPYLAMEYVEGGSLASRLTGVPWPPREAARLVQTLAGAVQAAHQRDILHRDLKPGNILIDAEGVAKVSDFGLAKLLNLEGGYTQTEAVLGTPAYMSPEQARGDTKAIGPLADVYGLGAILYELLTGRPPFRAATRLKTLEQVRTQDPVPPTRLNPGVERDLEAVCLKCLEKEPACRYASAGGLADDLGRWLRGEPTLARPPRWPARTWRMIRKHPFAAAALAACVVGICIGLAGWVYLDPDRPRRETAAVLARRLPATVIPASGKPPYSRWCLGEDTARTYIAADGGFSIYCSELALLEIVPDPQRDANEIKVGVRHERDGGAGEAGVYLGIGFILRLRANPCIIFSTSPSTM